VFDQATYLQGLLFAVTNRHKNVYVFLGFEQLDDIQHTVVSFDTNRVFGNVDAIGLTGFRFDDKFRKVLTGYVFFVKTSIIFS